MDNLKYLVVEQKIVDGTAQSVNTPFDNKDDAEAQADYASWYNWNDKNCSAYTINVQGPMGEVYYNKHKTKPVKPAEPETEA